MAELVLTKRVKYAGDVHAELLKAGWDLEAATLFVNNIPDADAVEVVRCKDCKEWSELLLDRLPAGVGDCRFHMMTTDAHFFCACGERKDGG